MKTLADFVSEIPPELSNDEPALKLGNGGKPTISLVPKKKSETAAFTKGKGEVSRQQNS